MSETNVYNWNLSVIYEFNQASRDIPDFIDNLSSRITFLTHKLDNSSLTNHEWIALFEEMQFILSASHELDDFLVCVQSERMSDPHIEYLVTENSKVKMQKESLINLFSHKLAEIPENNWIQLIKHEKVAPNRFYLEEKRRFLHNRLPVEYENIINHLSVDGFIAWEELHEQILSNVRIEILQNNEKYTLSIGQAINEAYFSSEQQKRKIVAKEIKKQLTTVAPIVTSILNCISGFRLVIYRQRGWNNILQEMLEENRIKEDTLVAMMDVINSKQSLFQPFLKRKAQLNNSEKLAWYDLQISSFTSDEIITYPEGIALIMQQFYQFSDSLGQFAEKAYKQHWIEAEDRSDKVQGAFCASMPLAKESRIFLTYRNTYLDIVTLAHELGHGYHNKILHEEPAFLQEIGTSVAETASTFAENLVIDAAIENAKTLRQKLALLELKILRSLNYIGVIPQMFKFEQMLYRKRMSGILSCNEINSLMLEVQRELYGDTVNELNDLHWVMQPHIYDTEKAFYNIPYTIGYLFSNKIYAISKQKGKTFHNTYDELLRHSGSMTMEQLAEKFLNEDITKKAFWYKSLEPIVESIEEYLRLTEALI